MSDIPFSASCSPTQVAEVASAQEKPRSQESCWRQSASETSHIWLNFLAASQKSLSSH